MPRFGVRTERQLCSALSSAAPAQPVPPRTATCARPIRRDRRLQSSERKESTECRLLDAYISRSYEPT
eukprot:5534979-Pyramimonas_sp.AAC.2